MMGSGAAKRFAASLANGYFTLNRQFPESNG
jgi:hypothetical protein